MPTPHLAALAAEWLPTVTLMRKPVCYLTLTDVGCSPDLI